MVEVDRLWVLLRVHGLVEVDVLARHRSLGVVVADIVDDVVEVVIDVEMTLGNHRVACLLVMLGSRLPGLRGLVLIWHPLNCGLLQRSGPAALDHGRLSLLILVSSSLCLELAGERLWSNGADPRTGDALSSGVLTALRVDQPLQLRQLLLSCVSSGLPVLPIAEALDMQRIRHLPTVDRQDSTRIAGGLLITSYRRALGWQNSRSWRRLVRLCVGFASQSRQSALRAPQKEILILLEIYLHLT